MEKKDFDAAVGRYQDMVYRVALHVVASPHDAEDAVQEVFLRLYTYKKPFDSEEHLRRWLIRVTVNHCKNILKSGWRKRRVSLEDVTEQPVFDRPVEQELYNTVLSLPEKYRTVLYLFYYEELPTAEVAHALGLGQSAVTTRLSRARALLKKELGEDWKDE